jgi:hypothetical protein
MYPAPCRSWLASEEAVPVDINAVCHAAIASKLAPTGIAVYTNIASKPDRTYNS